MKIGSISGMGIEIPYKMGWMDNATGTVAISNALLYAGILRLGEGGTITKVGVPISTTPSASGTLRVRLETLTGQAPSGSLIAAGAEGTLAAVATSGMKEVTIGTPPTIAVTDSFAVVVDSTNTLVASVDRSAHTGRNIPYTAAFSGTWGFAAQPPRLTFFDGTKYLFAPDVIPSAVTSLITISPASNPREIGGKFVMPFSCYVVGFAITVAALAAGDAFVLRLYSSDGVTVIGGPHSRGGGEIQSNTSGYFPVPQTPRVSSGATVYLAMDCTASSVQATFSDVLVSGMFRTQFSDDASSSYPVWVQRAAVGSGAWAETTTRKPECRLLVIPA